MAFQIFNKSKNMFQTSLFHLHAFSNSGSFSSFHLFSSKYNPCFKSEFIKRTHQSRCYINFIQSKLNGLRQCQRHISTTRVNHVPPIVWVLIRPFTKIFAVILGRSFRKWYQSLSPEKKQLTKNWFKANYVKFILIASGFAGLSFAYYETHIQETPITKRQRFIIFTEKQYKSIANYGYKTSLELFNDKILPNIHPICRRVEKVARRILTSNHDIKEIYNKEWTVVVIDAPEIKNAFVTPNGHMFVFSGMLNICSNDDQLGIVLSHEMAHAILGHSAEVLSHAAFIDVFLMIILGLIWALIPSDLFAALVHFSFNKLMQITLELPYNRKLEIEADEIGLTLASKACFDIRESVVFWKKMALLEVLELDLPPGIEMPKEIEFLLTHPSHESRAKNLDSLLPDAIKLRDSCNCPRLPLIDPRVILEQKIKLMEKQKAFNDKVIQIKLPRPI